MAVEPGASQLERALCNFETRLEKSAPDEAKASVASLGNALKSLCDVEARYLEVLAEGERLQGHISRLVVPKTYVFLIAGTIVFTISAGIIMGNPSLQLYYFVGVAVMFALCVGIYLKQANKYAHQSRPLQDALAACTVEMASLLQTIDGAESKLDELDFDFGSNSYTQYAEVFSELWNSASTAPAPADRVRRAVERLAASR